MDDQGWVPINLISNFKKVSWFDVIWMPDFFVCEVGFITD